MHRIRARRPVRHYVREWIAHLNLDQKRVAERMDTTEAQVSRLLSGQRRMTLEWLAAFAQALDRDIDELLRDPLRPTQQDLLNALPPDARERAMDYLRYLSRSDKTGTKG